MAGLFVPLDGRITSQNVLDLPLTGGEVMEIVSPGNAAEGNTYQVTTGVLAAFFAAFPFLFSRIVVRSGATLGSPLPIPTTATEILINKSVASASYAVAPLAGSMVYPFPVLIKDLKGDADVNPIQVSFTGGELCDGLETLTIGNPYGWVTINPVPSGGGWYQS